MGKNCLFCDNQDTFNSESHIIPESLGNKKFILNPGIVCDKCNQYFSKLERIFCNNHLAVVEKIFYLKKTKKGKTPKLEFDRTKIERLTDDKIRIDIKNYNAENFTIEYGSNDFTFNYPDIELPPVYTGVISRTLVKMGIETLNYRLGEFAYNDEFKKSRNYARYAKRNDYIPFLFRLVGQNKNIMDINLCKFEILDFNEMEYYFAWIIIPGCLYMIPLNTENLDVINSVAYALKMTLFPKRCKCKPKPLKMKIHFEPIK